MQFSHCCTLALQFYQATGTHCGVTGNNQHGWNFYPLTKIPPFVEIKYRTDEAVQDIQDNT